MGPAQIDHLDRDKVVIIQANVEGKPLNDVVQGINQRLATLHLPARLRNHPGRRGPGPERGVQPDLSRPGRRGAAHVPDPGGAVRLLPRPGRHPDLAPAVAHGVVLALWVTKSTLNIMSLIGVILLMGIVVKNARCS